MVLLIVGAILVISGGVLFFVKRHHSGRAYCLKVSRPATVAELEKMSSEIAQEIGGGNWRDYVRLAGRVQCDRPLVSQLAQQPCVYYSMTVRREYEETVTRRDSDGKEERTTERGSETVASHQQSTPFVLKDHTGAIAVDPNQADFETITVLDEFRPESPGNFLSVGGFSLALSPQGAGRRTIGYRYQEVIVPIDRQVTVVATVSDAGTGLTLQRPTESGKQFIISLRNAEELTKSAERNAKASDIAMKSCLVGGSILAIAGLVTGL
ncbi:MAG: E3 ubiquitin ligase [Cyanobacteria bacterium J069]|nr:MAG: E3 ubiquitin ligase [Cyanobacteria bacterium J069]